TLWIRWKLREPEQWQKAKQSEAEDQSLATGRFSDLFAGENLRNSLVGVALASIGLTTFWGCHIYGKNALLTHAQKAARIAEGVPHAPPAIDELVTKKTSGELTEDEFGEAVIQLRKPYTQARSAAYKKHNVKQAEMLSMVLNTIGGGLGLVLFGWFANRLGRKGAFVFYHVLGFVFAVLMFKVLIPNEASPLVLGLMLPVFGFFTLGMHAGYAVYFPELFPTRLRGTGAGFCFNGGRILQGVAFFGIGAMGLAPGVKALWLAPLYLVGAVVVLAGKETKGQSLPD
ncbi:MAG: hypothetical protein AB8G99_17190, partial [Planctomycetaceae bacterium]